MRCCMWVTYRWGRVNKAEDVLSVGQQIEVKVLKIDPEKQRISVGMKQLLPHPWDALALKAEIVCTAW